MTLFVRLHARPGRADAVMRAIRTVGDASRAESGCIAFDAYASVRDQDEFFIHSQWRDIEAFERHAALAHTREFIAEMEVLLDHDLKVVLAKSM